MLCIGGFSCRAAKGQLDRSLHLLRSLSRTALQHGTQGSNVSVDRWNPINPVPAKIGLLAKGDVARVDAFRVLGDCGVGIPPFLVLRNGRFQCRLFVCNLIDVKEHTAPKLGSEEFSKTGLNLNVESSPLPCGVVAIARTAFCGGKRGPRR